jgi:hypothetical protein
MLINHDRINPHVPGGCDVANTSTLVLAANPDRRYAVFTNDSDSPIYLAIWHTAVAHTGIRLNPNGGSYEIDFKNYYVGDVTAIHDSGSGTKKLCVQEG